MVIAMAGSTSMYQPASVTIRCLLMVPKQPLEDIESNYGKLVAFNLSIGHHQSYDDWFVKFDRMKLQARLLEYKNKHKKILSFLAVPLGVEEATELLNVVHRI